MNALKISVVYHLNRCDRGRQAGLSLIIYCQPSLNCVLERMAAPPISDENKMEEKKKRKV